MEAKVKFGISKKLTLMLLIVALVPLMTIWFLSYRHIVDLTNEKVNQRLTSINENLVTYVDAWIDMNERMMIQNSSLDLMQSMDPYLQEPILKSITKYYDWAYLTFTVDLKGDNISRSDGQPLKYYGDRSYFKQVTEGKQIGRQVLIGKTSGIPAMVLSTGIYDEENNLKGVLAQAMTLAEVSEKIVSNTIGVTGYTFLLDEKGLVIAHPDTEMTKSRMDLSRHNAFVALQNGQTQTLFDDLNGEKIIAVAQKTAQGFTMISQQNVAEAYQQIKKENQKNLLLLGGTLIMILASAIFVSKWLTGPIRNLTEIADKYSQGQLDLEISGTKRSDEIGQLSRAVERMGTSIRLAMKRLQKKK